MAYWWERYEDTPDDNTSSPPDGAPENHFPDQVNNIQRQAMAAVAEIGEKVLGPGDGSQAPQVAVSISGAFLKLTYDAILPVGSIMAFHSDGGDKAIPVPDFPEFAGVVWTSCDGIGTSLNFENDVLLGAQFAVGPGENRSGDAVVAGQTGDGGAGDTSAAVTGGHALVEDELGAHGHAGGTLDFTTDDPGTHNHGAGPLSGGGQVRAGSDGALRQVTGSENGAHTHSRNLAVPWTGATEDTGGDLPHDHPLDTLVIPDHAHLTGQPPGKALELYVRTA